MSGPYVNLDILSVHTNSSCSLSSSLGSVVVSQFINDGIIVHVPVNVTTPLYVTSKVEGGCILLSSFSSTSLLPSVPTFVTVSPQSPSRLTSAPGLFGEAFPLSANVEFFSDENCTQQLATGSASQFSQFGISVQLPLNATTSIYAHTKDSRNVVSTCTFMTDFTHSNAYSPYPELLSVTPLSPNNQSFTPNIRGIASSEAVSVTLYSDSGCINQIATGTTQDFENQGFDVSLNQNATTVIYARSVDALDEPSICALLTTYTHDNLPPANLSYSSISPVSPTNQTLLPRITGQASNDTQQVVFYDSNLCINSIGLGLRSEFVGSGVVVNVRENNTTNIYAKAFDGAGNGSNCLHLTDYVHNLIAPLSPLFVSLDPSSPTNLTITPKIIGIASERTTALDFYKDEDCTLLIGQGNVATYENEGVLLNADTNATTSIYAQVRDFEGNISECYFHASFAHSVLPAPNPGFVASYPASPSRVSTNPAILGTAHTTIATVRIYQDATCTQQLSSGTRAQFVSSGIITPVPTNSTNPLYSRVTDIYNNVSACVLLTTYIHNNVQPLNPTYTSTTPISPNNQSASPLIIGDVLFNPASQLPPSRVEFFDSLSCVSKLGEGSPTDYLNAGITINVATNAESTIYGKSFDAAGNESDCTFLTFYTHNSLLPGAPVFASINPTSPSFSANVRLIGTYNSSTDFMNKVSMGIYSDAACSQLIQSENPALLNTTGIVFSVNSNATTALYGQSVNEVGTPSSCQLLTTFTHNDSAPANFTVISNANGSVRLSWNPDVLSNPTPRYTVERSRQSNGPFTILSSEQIVNNYTDNQISNNETYYYRIYASNSTGRSLYSSVVGITVSAPSPVVSNNLVATVADSQVTLNWGGFPQNMTYRIFKSLQFGGPFTDLGVSQTTTTYVDSSLINNQSYYYYVKASNPAGESVQSNIVSAIPKVVPNAPTELMLTPVYSSTSCSGNKSTRLSWAGTSYFDNFAIYRGNNKTSLNPYATSSIPYYDDCSFSQNMTYYYSVVSNWGSNQSDMSNVVGHFTSNAPILTISPAAAQLILNWNAPTAPSEYFPGDLRYTIYKSLDPEKNFIVFQDNYSSTTFVDSVANNSGAYYYVQAYVIDSDGLKIYIGSPSEIRSGKAAVNPSAPSNLVLNYYSDGSRAQLDWVSPTHFNRFIIYRSINVGGPFTQVQTTASPFLTSASLIEGMNYFRITAMWGSFETASTNTVSFRHAPITDFSLVSQADRLNLSWNAVTGAQDYIISRSNFINGPFVDHDVSSNTSYSDLSVNLNTGYYYKVRARFSDLTQGQNSSVVSGQSIDFTVPSGLSLTVIANTFIRVDWPTVAGATSYEVLKSLNSSGPYESAGTTPLNSFNLVNLTPQTEYFVKVVATVGGQPHESSVVSAWTLLPTTAPEGTVGNNQVSILWTPMVGALNYNIQRSTNGVTFSTISTNYPSSTYTDATATNGNIYYYRVQTNYAPLQLISSSSIGLSPGRTPLAPSQLSVENNGTGNQVVLKWSDISGRTSFNIYRSTTSGSYGAPSATSNTPHGTLVTGLTLGSRYYFRVTALNGSNESAPSNEVVITLSTNPPKPNVNFNSSSSILVSWSAPPNANNYAVYRSEDGVNFIQLTSYSTALSHIDSTINPLKTYYYKYQSRTGSSSELPMSEMSDPINISISPNRPTDLKLVSTVANPVKLFWSSISNVINYEISRSSTSGGPYTFLVNVASPSVSFEDTSVSLGQNYYYVIRSVNSSGVKSSVSNEVSVSLVSGPSNLLAANSATGIDLSWNSIPGVSGYEVLRSQVLEGPYGIVISTAGVSGLDTNVVTSETYHYVVQGVYADGRRTMQSTPVSILRDGSLRLQVPIELLDTGIASSDDLDLVFERTLTSFNSNDYDGVVSYELEVIATNSDSANRSVGITNESDVLIGYVTIPANTYEPTLVKGVITISVVGLQKLRMQLQRTTFDGQLSVMTARLLVNQVNATKTKLYYPLLGSDEEPSNFDNDVFVYATSNNAYHDFRNAYYFSRRANHLQQIQKYNGWELEVLVSTQGGSEGKFGLHNINTGQLVPLTETRFSSPNLQLASVSFGEGATQFGSINEGHNYRFVMRCEFYCGSGTVRVHKAGLWVKLNNLSKYSVIYRVTPFKNFLSSSTVLEDYKTHLTLSRFSQPKVYYQVLAETDSSSYGTLSLVSHADNSGSSNLISVLGSEINIEPEAVRFYRTLELTSFPADQNIMTSVDSVNGQIMLRGSQLLVE